MKKTTKIITVASVVFLLTFLCGYIFLQHNKTQEFQSYKQDILSEFEGHLQYTTVPEEKTQLQSMITKVEKTTNEEDLFSLLEENITGEDIASIDFPESKKKILTEVTEELASITDAKTKTKLQQQITELSKIEDQKVFFEKLKGVYNEFDTFYKEHNIDAFGDEDMKEYDFSKEKDILLESIKREVADVSDEKIKKQLEGVIVELEKLENEDQFFEKLSQADRLFSSYYGTNKDNIGDPQELESEVEENIEISDEDMKLFNQADMLTNEPEISEEELQEQK